MRKILLGVFILIFFISSKAFACPACVDSGLLYFLPFLGYWFGLLILWLLGRIVFKDIGKRKGITLSLSYFKWPTLSFIYWFILFFLSYGALRAGGFVQLMTFIILPSWLIAYILSFVKTWKLRSEHPLYKAFVIYQVVALIIFFLAIPLSYVIPRKMPHNVRTVDDDISRQYRPAHEDIKNTQKGQ